MAKKKPGRKPKGSREDVIKKMFLECLEENFPKLNSSIDITKVVESSGTRGLLRAHMRNKGEDFLPSDRRIFQIMLHDMKDVLYHKGGDSWVRIK